MEELLLRQLLSRFLLNEANIFEGDAKVSCVEVFSEDQRKIKGEKPDSVWEGKMIKRWIFCPKYPPENNRWLNLKKNPHLISMKPVRASARLQRNWSKIPAFRCAGDWREKNKSVANKTITMFARVLQKAVFIYSRSVDSKLLLTSVFNWDVGGRAPAA